MKRDIERAINNIEKVIEHYIDNPPEGYDVNSLVKDYNVIRQEIVKILATPDEE